MLALLLAPQAHALIYTGNPDFGVEVTRLAGDYVEGTVHLDKVRIVECDATWKDYTIDADPDPVAGFTLTVDGGDLCAAVFYWGSDLVIDGALLGGDCARQHSHISRAPVGNTVEKAVTTAFIGSAAAAGTLANGLDPQRPVFQCHHPAGLYQHVTASP